MTTLEKYLNQIKTNEFNGITTFDSIKIAKEEVGCKEQCIMVGLGIFTDKIRGKNERKNK